MLVIQSRTIKFSNLLQKLYMNLFWNKNIVWGKKTDLVKSKSQKRLQSYRFQCAPQPIHIYISRDWKSYGHNVFKHNFCTNHWWTRQSQRILARKLKIKDVSKGITSQALQGDRCHSLSSWKLKKKKSRGGRRETRVPKMYYFTSPVLNKQKTMKPAKESVTHT